MDSKKRFNLILFLPRLPEYAAECNVLAEDHRARIVAQGELHRVVDRLKHVHSRALAIGAGWNIGIVGEVAGSSEMVSGG